MDFYFNKAFYTRIGFKEMKMYGRVFRLFVSPLLETLRHKLGRRSIFLDYLNSFKYPLSGEFSLTSDLALNIRIPGDWGVEIGILSEVFRNTSPKRICQTDLGFHDHKHRKIGDRKTGLVKMAGDIEKSLLRNLQEVEEVNVSDAFIQSIQVLYRRLGQDYIHSYGTDSFFNTLAYERHAEESVLGIFSDVVLKAGKEYLKSPFGALIPSWARVLSAFPNLREDLRDAAKKDLESA
jgi:glucosyl-3-phosphoglycerate synthase